MNDVLHQCAVHGHLLAAQANVGLFSSDIFSTSCRSIQRFARYDTSSQKRYSDTPPVRIAVHLQLVFLEDGPTTVAESTVSNTELSGPHRVLGSELSEFLSAYNN